jgi:hypothetical protein
LARRVARLPSGGKSLRINTETEITAIEMKKDRAA